MVASLAVASWKHTDSLEDLGSMVVEIVVEIVVGKVVVLDK